MPVLKNQRHELFAQGLAKGMTGDAAHTAAGYAPNRKNASALKTKKDVIARVLELQANRADRSILSRQWVIDALLENAEKALGRRPVTLGEKGSEKQVFVYEAQAANQAMRMAGLEMGMFTERRDVKITSQFAPLTDQELAQRLVEVGRQMLEGPQTIEHEDEAGDE